MSTKTAILVAAENRDTCKQVVEALRPTGLRLKVVPRGSDALDAARAAQADLLILDVDTVGPGCGRVTRSIRSDETTDAIPVFLVGSGSPRAGEIISDAMEEGASDYILKPFRAEVLAGKVRSLLGEREKEATAGPQDVRDQIGWEIRTGHDFPFGHYMIHGLVGRGGMGSIYRATDTRSEREVAIKILAPVFLRNRGLLDRYLREARTVASIRHPNVIQFFETGEIEGAYYIAMEYVAGGSIKDVIDQEGHLDEDVALEITSQAASALEALFQHGIVHRDVKPGNILLGPRGRIKLVDFGLAKSPGSRSLTRAGTILGTPRYIAPEQAREGSKADTRSDIYSLGVTLYHMLTGSVPFMGEDTEEIISKHMARRPVPVSQRMEGISPPVTRLVSIMLAKKPEDRFQNPSELLEGIRLAKAGQNPAGAVGKGAPPPGNKRGPRPRPCAG